jgi:hypothetical protein
MIIQRLAWCAMLGLALAACAEREPAIAPAIPPVPPDLLQRAVAGDARAQFQLADHLWPAHPGDPEPLFWLRAAAVRGDAPAQASLGAVYLNGDGVPQDFLEAYAWYALATAQGEPEALKIQKVLHAELSEPERAWAQELARLYSRRPRRANAPW